MTWIILFIFLCIIVLCGRAHSRRLDEYEAKMKRLYGIPTFDERKRGEHE